LDKIYNESKFIQADITIWIISKK